MAYVFRLNRAASGQSRAVTTWFAALFDINPEINRDAVQATINNDFLAKLTSAKAPPPADTGPSKTFQTPPTSKKAGRSPEFRGQPRPGGQQHQEHEGLVVRRNGQLHYSSPI